MSNISIKKDFADGDILPASDLNNNFRVIEAGVNANDEQLEQIIEDAITRLDAELIAITADRGWDWNGGDRVTFFKGDTTQVNNQQIKNGQLLYNISTGETSLDDNGSRIVTGSGNVIAIDDEEPTNPATKLWINPDETLQNIGTEVVNSMRGNETTMAPSVSAVKSYVNGDVLYDNSTGTSGDVTLANYTDSNYSHLIVYWKTTFNGNRFGVTLASVSGGFSLTSVDLDWTDGSQLYGSYALYNISKANSKMELKFAMDHNGSSNNNFIITKVIGCN